MNGIKILQSATCAVLLGCSLSGPVYAASIFAGSDYLTTVDASFDFGGAIGLVGFTGAFGPGVADTVLTRLEDAILTVGGSDTIAIQMRLLELVSVAPVNIGGDLFDVRVHLDPARASTGTMTINHEFPDNATAAPEGTFTSNLLVNFVASFAPVGAGTAMDVRGSLPLTTDPPASWTHNPPAGVLLVNGAPGDLNANCHNPPDCLTPANGPNISTHDFFVVFVDETHPNGARHRAAPAMTNCADCGLGGVVPEPGTYVTLVSGLVLLGAGAWRRKRQPA